MELISSNLIKTSLKTNIKKQLILRLIIRLNCHFVSLIYMPVFVCKVYFYFDQTESESDFIHYAQGICFGAGVRTAK